jgi:hypothetical protein
MIIPPKSLTPAGSNVRETFMATRVPEKALGFQGRRFAGCGFLPVSGSREGEFFASFLW